MKYIKYFLLSVMIFSCSNRDDSPNQEPQNLMIISFSPTMALAGEEVIFVGENIDVSKTYGVFFNGVASNNVQVFSSQIKAIVPQGATTGEIVIKYDGNSLSVGNLEITEEPILLITSFSPVIAYSGDEIRFIGENIDPTITYAVSFNGVESETISVTETEIVAIVPQGASSGEITISYIDTKLNVGTIEITEEIDKLYGVLPLENGDCDAIYIHNLDINSGALLNEIAELHNQSCYGNSSPGFYREANILVHTFTTRYGQGLPYGKACTIINLTSGTIGGWTLSDGGNYDGNILAAHDDKIFYIYRYYDGIDDIYEIRSRKLDNSNILTLYKFPTDFIYQIKNSGFLPSTNELVFFTTDENNQPIFMKFDIETATLTTNSISDTFTSIFITTNERIFGVKSLGTDLHEIVEIDKASGNILSSLATISTNQVLNIDYSISSNKIFALLEESFNSQFLYKLNLDDGTSIITPLDEDNQHYDFEGIYLNN